ncbi:MAG TPA: hypothetical protein VL853_03275 [Gemmatimonadales bacterium]|nr:hypothetical protein [Gemmatimonadales bacterium]
MINANMPVYLTAVGLAALGFGALVWQPYSADFPGTQYSKPIRGYIHAAAHQDSAALVRLSASPAAVTWGLTTGRAHRGSLAHWERSMQAWAGQQRGDTAQVFVFSGGTVCQNAPIELRLVGSDGAARVVKATSSCWSR